MSQQDLEELEEVFTELFIFKGIDLNSGEISRVLMNEPNVRNTSMFVKDPKETILYLYYKLMNLTNPTNASLRAEASFQDVILNY